MHASLSSRGVIVERFSFFFFILFRDFRNLIEKRERSRNDVIISFNNFYLRVVFYYVVVHTYIYIYRKFLELI